MKRRLIIVIVVLSVVLCGFLIVRNTRSVYFVDGATGDITKLTSFWLKQNEIEIKDRWFNEFEEDTVSGIVYIEDMNEYALIPYTYTILDPVDGDLGDLYYSKLNRVKAVHWISKIENESLDFIVENEQRLSIAVGTYSNTSYDETEYGMGIYSMPVYNNNGELYYNLQFPSNSLAGIRAGFNDGVPCYVLQEVFYAEISLVNHVETTFFLPLSFHGGLLSEDILDSDHYYINYNGIQLVFEASLERIE